MLPTASKLFEQDKQQDEVLALFESIFNPDNGHTVEAKQSVSFSEFKQLIWSNYEHPAHLALLDEKLSQVTRYIETRGAEGIGRLIVEMPPRHGKTMTVSRLYPPWHLGRNPNDRVMLVSYGQDLANKNSRGARNLIRSSRYRAVFPHVSISRDSSSVSAWDLANGVGGMDALGIGAGATGKGANLLIVDDAIKNREQAESKTYRDKTWDSFTDDLYTRLEPGGAIVLMFTRWHEDDLIGRVLANMPNEEWTRLRLPAFAESGDPLGRDVGEALWPARFDTDRLQEIQKALGEYSFSALYQQTPLPAGGGLFKTEHIDIIDHAPACKQVVRFYDLAVTAKKSADYTAGVKLGITHDERIIVFDVYRVQKAFPDVEKDIIQNALIDGHTVRIRLEAEKAGIIGLDYLLRRPELRAYTLDKKPPHGDKYTRAQPIASRVNEGRVSLVRGAWNRAFIDELATFPAGAHDDMVDALSGAWDMVGNTPTWKARTV